jgi:hypothetical protein
MNTPNAVKVFMWRAYHNALATKANLFQWNITEDPLCPTYGVEVETMGHVLWSFPATKYSLQKTRHLLTWLLFTFFATLAITNVLNFNTLVMGPKKKTLKKNKNFSNVSL